MKPLDSKITPYDTGKVRIGVAYQRRQEWHPSTDAYLLQSALLYTSDKPPALPQTLGQRLWERLAFRLLHRFGAL